MTAAAPVPLTPSLSIVSQGESPPDRALNPPRLSRDIFSLPLSKEQIKAAQLIKSILRRSHAALAHVTRDFQLIAELPCEGAPLCKGITVQTSSKADVIFERFRDMPIAFPQGKFQTAIRRISDAWKKRPRTFTPSFFSITALTRCFEEVFAIQYLMQARQAHHKKITLLFTLLGKGLPPHCQLSDSIPIGASLRDHVFVIAHPMQVHQPTRKEIDNLIQMLSIRTDIFIWNRIDEGCYVRAAIILRYLYQMGISKDHLGKVYLAVPHAFMLPQKEGITWNYHVMATVKLHDGSTVGLDPALEPRRGLTISEWIEKQMKPSMPLCILPQQRKPGIVQYDAKKAILFHTTPNLCMEMDPEKSQFHFLNEVQETIDSGLDTLAHFREKEDEKLIGHFLPSPPIYFIAPEPDATPVSFSPILPTTS